MSEYDDEGVDDKTLLLVLNSLILYSPDQEFQECVKIRDYEARKAGMSFEEYMLPIIKTTLADKKAKKWANDRYKSL